MKQYYVYILASKKNGTLYTGITSNLIARTYTHKFGGVSGFTKKYAVNQLVYFEIYQDVSLAIKREKNIKNWRRAWKLALIEQGNPNWNDLYNDIAA